MANETFYVSVKTPRAAIVYAFTRSVTGILDYAGEATPTVDELSQMQCVEGSAYFTPSWYTYLPNELQASVDVYLPSNVENLDVGQYSFLLHVGRCCLRFRNAMVCSLRNFCAAVRWCLQISCRSCCIS